MYCAELGNDNWYSRQKLNYPGYGNGNFHFRVLLNFFEGKWGELSEHPFRYPFSFYEQQYKIGIIPSKGSFLYYVCLYDMGFRQGNLKRFFRVLYLPMCFGKNNKNKVVESTCLFTHILSFLLCKNFHPYALSLWTTKEKYQAKNLNTNIQDKTFKTKILSYSWFFKCISQYFLLHKFCTSCILVHVIAIWLNIFLLDFALGFA